MRVTPIVNIGTAWPWPTVNDDFKAGGSTWFESVAEHWEYGLGVLPPIYFPGGFFVGEPSNCDKRGVTTYNAWVKIGNRFFVREIARDQHAEALTELRAALAAETVPA